MLIHNMVLFAHIATFLAMIACAIQFYPSLGGASVFKWLAAFFVGYAILAFVFHAPIVSVFYKLIVFLLFFIRGKLGHHWT